MAVRSLDELAAFLDRCGRRFRIAYQGARILDEFPTICRAVFGSDADPETAEQDAEGEGGGGEPPLSSGGSTEPAANPGLGPCCFVLEEGYLFCSPDRIHPLLVQINSVGRPRGIDLVAVAQRAATINRLITSQTWELISFCQTEPADLAYLREFGGEQFAAGIDQLPPGRWRRKIIPEPWRPIEEGGEEFRIVL